MKPLVIHGLLPILIGATIYLLLSPAEILFFKWFQIIGLSDFINLLRSHTYNLRSYSQYKIVNHLPDYLWAYSFSSTLILFNKNIFINSWILPFIPVLLDIFLEILQLNNILAGTFDYFDILAYLLGSLLSFFIL